jgi:hypothetical protein
LQVAVPFWVLVVQGLPQPPQLLGSVCSLTQALEQRDIPLSHAKPHLPDEQTGVALVPAVHAVELPHWPFELHVWTSVLSAHCEAPGEHTPEHCPLMHTYWQAVGLPHAPAEEQVSTPLLTHCVVPGVHDPAQVPELHVYWHAAPLFCQLPLPSQLCGWLPLHCVAPGVQVPVQPPELQT